LQTLTTVGYGSPNAAGNTLEQIVATLWMLFGVFFQSNSIGVFISLIEENDRDTHIMVQKLETLKNHKKDMSSNLFRRVMLHIEHN
jgi:hypothetical protein